MVTIEDFAKLEFKVGKVLSAEEVEGSERLLKLTVDFGPAENVEFDSSEEISIDENPELSLKGQEDGEVEGSFNEQKTEIRQILSGIKKWYSPDELKDKQFIFITNLEPRKMMGMESQGMLLAAEGEEKPVPLIPQEEVVPGSKIR